MIDCLISQLPYLLQPTNTYHNSKYLLQTPTFLANSKNNTICEYFLGKEKKASTLYYSFWIKSLPLKLIKNQLFLFASMCLTLTLKRSESN